MGNWPPQHIVGCMSGTSCDGVDVVSVEIVDGNPCIIAGHEHPLGALGQRLLAFASGEPASAADVSALRHELAAAHLEALARVDAARADLVVVHGQTVFHAPPQTWQLVDAAAIAHGLGVPVLFDLRSADCARGGQGAPITPLADRWLYPGDDRRAVVNLGGFVNCTILDGDAVVAGFDVCAGNQLLDTAARRLLGQPYDADGQHAAAGTIHGAAVNELAAALQAQLQGRSLGSGDEELPWLDTWSQRLTPVDCLATAGAAVARAVMAGLTPYAPARVWCAGGGVRNRHLMRHLTTIGDGQGMRVMDSDATGVPAQWREAAAMAVLGWRCALGEAITLPLVTGVRSPAPLAGSWIFPGGLPASS